MELAKILALIVIIVWLLLLFIFLLVKDIRDRKYNKVLKTKDQMMKEDKNKF